VTAWKPPVATPGRPATDAAVRSMRPSWRIDVSRVPRRTAIRELSPDRGSASLEFLTAGLILLVPLVYLILSLSQLQAGALAVEGAAREAARVYVQAASPDDARDSATRAVEFALSDYGVDPATATVSVECAPDPSSCLVRRGFVSVSVRVTVDLPLAPAALGIPSPLTIPLDASATQQVSRFWSAG
jgi:Flp pilus assembly protein TadG